MPTSRKTLVIRLSIRSTFNLMEFQVVNQNYRSLLPLAVVELVKFAQRIKKD